MKKFFISYIVILFLWCIGCSTPQQQVNIDYLRCNATSTGDMAEIESGFFYEVEGILYYADKRNINNWVPFCNKPDCQHNSHKCNAIVGASEMAQKGEVLYYYNTYDKGIHELSKDGSGSKLVYRIPVEAINVRSHACYLSQQYALLQYSYLMEDGKYQENLVRVEEDGTTHTLFSNITENLSDNIVMSSRYYLSRGDITYFSNIWLEEDAVWTKVLWRLGGEEAERVNLPENQSVAMSYLTEDTFTYYKKGEGFCEIDLESGKESLLLEKQLEDGRGYRLTDEYFIETNRYLDYTPQDAYLKFYNGEEWIDVKLPEEVKHEDYAFYPKSIASDRVFFVQEDIIDGIYGNRLYYFLIEEKEPELVYCSSFGCELEVLQKEDTTTAEVENEKQDNLAFQKIEEEIIFDNDLCLLKLTGLGWDDEKTSYKMEVYWENRDLNKDYLVELSMNINGILVDPYDGIDSIASKEGYLMFRLDENELKASNITNLYDITEFTDIGMEFRLEDFESGAEYEKIVHVYPQGEENRILYERETESTDYVIINNAELTVSVIDYKKSFLDYDIVQFFIQNKTDKTIKFSLEETAVNELLANENRSISVPAGVSAFYSTTVCDSDFITAFGIDEIGKIQLLIKAYQSEYFSGNVIGETFLDELITLYPQGEEKTLKFVREEKTSDIVLIDNEYVKVVTNVDEDISNIDFTGNSVPLFVTNKTNEIITLKLEAASANHLMSNIRNINEEIHIFPQNSAVVLVEYFEYQTGDNREVLLRCYDYGSETAKEDLVTESVTIITGDDINNHVREAKDTDKMIVDNEDVSIIFTEFDEYPGNPTNQMGIYVVNKTNKGIILDIHDVLINNKKMETEGYLGLEENYIFAGASKEYYITLGTVMQKNHIANLDSIELTFCVSQFEYTDGDIIQELVREHVKITP